LRLHLLLIKHNQEKRKNGVYQNADFEGYRIIRGLKGDEIEVVNIRVVVV
jgi:hypothetical protein